MSNFRISSNNKIQDKGSGTIYPFRELVLTESNANTIFGFDHAPALFNGKRNDECFKSCDWLWLDSDDGFSIEEFRNHQDFKDCSWILYTSKSHQKEKIHGNGSVDPPVDRFHVLFPIPVITDIEELRKKLGQIVAAYPWADKGAQGACRFLYGSPGCTVIWNHGKTYRPPEKFIDDLFDDDGNKKPVNQRNTVKIKGPTDGTMMVDSEWSDDTRREAIHHLTTAANSGHFSEYSDWLMIGAAMQVSGFDLSDWISISDGSQSSIDDATYKWNGKMPTDRVTTGTLVHYIRQVAPEFLQKGSMPAIPKITISKTSQRSDFYKTTAPTQLETPIDDEKAQEVYNQITTSTTDEHGKTKRKLMQDWYIRILALDPAIAGCCKYDYTVGSPITAYSNTELLKTALRRRLRRYGIPENAMNDEKIKLMVHEIMFDNRNHNRVLSFVDMLREKHGGGSDYTELLNKLIGFFEFEPLDDYSPEQCREYYRETLHLFLYRMHLHIRGTEKLSDGEYRGLIANDIVPILQGPQNIGKTTFCQWLTCNRGDMYVDLGSGGKDKFGGADTIRQVRGKMVAELGEMGVTTSRKNEVETIKSFISKDKYDLDVKYVEHSEPLPATVSYIGTANMDEFLNDPSGNRRFYPIYLRSIDKDGLTSSIELMEQIHAAYGNLALETPEESIYEACRPSKALVDFMNDRRIENTVMYPDYGAVSEVVLKDYEEQRQLNTRSNGVHKIQDYQILAMVKKLDAGIMVGRNAIQEAMRGLGYTKKSAKIGGHVTKTWVKPL